MKKINKEIIYIGITILLSILIILFSKGIYKSGFLPDKYNKQAKYYKAEVVELIEDNLEYDEKIGEIKVGFQSVVVEVREGPLKGQIFQVGNPVSRLYNIETKIGTKVIVSNYEVDGTNNLTIFSYDRSKIIYTLIAIFIITVIAIGGLKGLKSIVSLIFTLICIVYLMVPLMLRGVNPIFAGILIAVISTTITLLLVSGCNKKTLTAVLGTVGGVVIASIIAYCFGNLAHLSGATIEDAESLMYIAEDSNLKIKGLMFTGILIASLGAVMDVAMSIASSIFEIYTIDNNISAIKLFKSGMNIGKDLIGTMTNTLILAFAGGSLSLIIYLYTAQMPYNKFINLDILGAEIIQGISGSIGIVLALPITALVAAYLCTPEVQ